MSDTSSRHLDIFDILSGTNKVTNETTGTESVDSEATTGKGMPNIEETTGVDEESSSTVDHSNDTNTPTPKSKCFFLFAFVVVAFQFR